MAFRDEFPVLERIAYLNAGTDGPIPRAAVESTRTGGCGRTSSAGTS
jgi:L-cysteine/cystine lyase